MNQQVQPLVVPVLPAQVPAPLNQVTAESFAAVMSVIMAIWAGAWVLQQVLKVFKGEEVERPPLIPK